jgi:hypothetical protein
MGSRLAGRFHSGGRRWSDRYSTSGGERNAVSRGTTDEHETKLRLELRNGLGLEQAVAKFGHV